MIELVVGAVTLLGAGALTASTIYMFGLWKDTMHPTRRTAGWALANGVPMHPEDAGWRSTDRVFAGADGVTMPAWLIHGRGAASEAGPHIAVILHGHSRSRWDSLRRAAPWVERCALVVLLDMRGHGEARGGRTTLGIKEPEDIERVLNELAAEWPGARFSLIGHSMGAVVAVHAAARAEAAGIPVDSVHAIGPYDVVATPLRARLLGRGLPAGPFARMLLSMNALGAGKEVSAHQSAARVTAPIAVCADFDDMISPMADAERIAASARAGELRATRGVPHADLGVEPIGAQPLGAPPLGATPPPPA